MRSQFIAVLFVAVFLVSSRASAVGVFVEPVKDPGGLAAEAGSVTELLRSAVDDNKGFEPATSAATAQITLTPKLVRLGQNFILSVSRVEGGTVQKTSKMRASAVEDLDLVSTRIVRALLSGGSVDARDDGIQLLSLGSQAFSLSARGARRRCGDLRGTRATDERDSSG